MYFIALINILECEAESEEFESEAESEELKGKFNLHPPSKKFLIRFIL